MTITMLSHQHHPKAGRTGVESKISENKKGNVEINCELADKRTKNISGKRDKADSKKCLFFSLLRLSILFSCIDETKIVLLATKHYKMTI